MKVYIPKEIYDLFDDKLKIKIDKFYISLPRQQCGQFYNSTDKFYIEPISTSDYDRYFGSLSDLLSVNNQLRLKSAELHKENDEYQKLKQSIKNIKGALV